MNFLDSWLADYLVGCHQLVGYFLSKLIGWLVFTGLFAESLAGWLTHMSTRYHTSKVTMLF